VVVSHCDLAGGGAHRGDLQAHADPLLLLTVRLPRVLVETVVKVVRQVRTCTHTVRCHDVPRLDFFFFYIAIFDCL